MLIDVAALNAAIALFTALIAGVLLLVSRQQWRQVGVRSWLLASTLIAMGHAFNSITRPGVPDWLVSDVALHSIFLGGVCHLWGCFSFFSRVSRPRVIVFLGASFIAISLLLNLGFANPAVYGTWLWVGIAAINYSSLVVLYRYRKNLPSGTLLVLSSAFFVVGVVYTECALEDLFFPIDVQTGQPPHWLYVAGAILLISAQIGKGMGFLMLINDRLEQNLRLSADLDSLTGILNRRGFFQKAEQSNTLGLCSQERQAILMLDIDYFKSVNDRYGHLTGDLVLQEVVGRVSRVLRGNDFLARYGGEEFIALIHDVDPVLAVVVAERMRAEVSALPFEFDGHSIALSISVGVSVGAYVGTDLEAKIAKADAALYAAKREGRDRVVLADSAIPAFLATGSM